MYSWGSTVRRRVRFVDVQQLSVIDRDVVVVVVVKLSLPDDVDVGRDELIATAARAAKRTRHTDHIVRHCMPHTDQPHCH